VQTAEFTNEKNVHILLSLANIFTFSELMDTAKTKIAIFSHALGGGGAERFAAHLSLILDGLGFEIHNIILTETQDYHYAGVLLNLGALAKSEPRWKRKFVKAGLLKKYLEDYQIDTIIDNRPRNFQLSEWLTRQLYGNRKVYYLVQNHNLQNYLPSSVWLAKILYGQAEKIICVSKAIEDKVKSKYDFKNTVTIENPVGFTQTPLPSCRLYRRNSSCSLGALTKRPRISHSCSKRFRSRAFMKKLSTHFNGRRSQPASHRIPDTKTQLGRLR
jgi:uncharacterized membrane protein YbaN (DUF454 family)